MTENPYTLTVKHVCATLDISRQTLWKWVKAGTFPQPKKYGPRCLRWTQADIDAWLAGRN